MDGFVIVKLEADEIAQKDGLLGEFNSFVQDAAHGISFIYGNEGYFRIPYGGEISSASAGLAQFVRFLLSSGGSIVGMSSARNADGGEGTEIAITYSGHEERVLLSTLYVY